MIYQKVVFLSIFLLSTSYLSLSQELNCLAEIIDSYEKYNSEYKEKSKTNWPDVSLQAINRNRDHYKSLLARLEACSPITTDDKINKDLLSFILNDEIAKVENKSYLIPLNAEGGFITSMIYSSLYLQLQDDSTEANYLKKLESTPNYINDQIAHLKTGLQEDITVPKLIVENCLSLLRDNMNSDVFFLFKPLDDKVDPILRKNVLESFQKYLKFLENEYLPNTRSTMGIGENSNGKKYYEQRVQYFTTLEMTPAEVFEIGHQEVKRIRAEMEAVIDSLNYDGDFDSFVDFLRTDERFYAKSPEELLKHAAWLSKKAEEMLPRYFSVLPRLPFTVNPVPAEIAPNYTTGRYSGGSMKTMKAGEYWVNTYNLPARPLYVLAALTLHEAVPGHHLQGSLAQELEDLPKFRQSYYLSAFGEGWGLYSEFLGKEAGIYTDLYEEFGRLTYEMWRACRLVVDPGLHYFGWTRDQAVAFMKDNTSLSIHEVNTEINRYIGWPGQAVSYKIGELKIRELRKTAESELGDLFDIREFHDLLLSNGSIPLFTLENIVNSYINNKNKDVEKN